jgi:hypothetical protein
MLAAPGAAGLRHLADRRRPAGNRATLARKAEYRADALRLVARLLEDGCLYDRERLAEVHALTIEQAESADRALAKVLRHRADANGGRLRV